MATQYWICNTKPENEIICLKDLSWGVDPNSKSTYAIDQISQVKVGDGLFFYVSGGRGLVGYFLAASKVYKDSRQLWPDRTYPHRIKIESVKILLRPIPFIKFKNKIYNNRTSTLISNGASLLGKSMIPLSSKDAEFLLNLIG